MNPDSRDSKLILKSKLISDANINYSFLVWKNQWRQIDIRRHNFQFQAWIWKLCLPDIIWFDEWSCWGLCVKSYCLLMHSCLGMWDMCKAYVFGIECVTAALWEATANKRYHHLSPVKTKKSLSFYKNKLIKEKENFVAKTR